MRNKGDAMALYSVVVADAKEIGEAWGEIGVGGAGAMTEGKYVPLAVTAVLATPVSKPTPLLRFPLLRLLLPQLLPPSLPLPRCCC